jgi:AcrR family transcriptional regulator
MSVVVISVAYDVSDCHGDMIECLMGRWKPDAAGRLQQAAFELYAERGYEETTVAEIAERAGLTERTFFRHFADKREVLFRGSAELQELMVDGVRAVPPSATPMQAITAGLAAAGAMFDATLRPYSRQRQAVIDANPELQERELVKLASLAAALADALRGRGVQGPAAELTAEAGVAVFRVAFEHWIRDDSDRVFACFVDEGIAELRTVAAG